tara:strand:- start:661 stop:2529 length:1869 start_codon:yes stop_codon:yes gene_type:complete
VPLKKLLFKPGINKEITRYANEQGWYDCDKVRFRQGFPEKIGGWVRLSVATFLGVCRSLNQWTVLSGGDYLGIGTNLKFYLGLGGRYYDITPIRLTTNAGDVTFGATSGSTTLVVNDTTHGAIVGDFVTYSGAVSLGGAVTATVLNKEYQVITVLTGNTYEVTLGAPANSSDTGNGGGVIRGEYQINTGPAEAQALTGWGAGFWGGGAWGQSTPSAQALRMWHQTNFGEDLIFAPSGGALYYWDASTNPSTRGTLISALPGASDVPVVQSYVLSSDIYRFTFCFGANNIGQTNLDSMLVRWSDQEDITQWTPLATNQAGSIRLSRGSKIVTAIQARQEILVWTDSALYSFQYVGAPAVWGVQAVGSNTSIVSQNVVAFANGVSYWMGKDGFYMYDGRVQAMQADVRKYVFDNFNRSQYEQCFAGTVEAFNEVWFYYCSEGSTAIDRYVIYNYVENIWMVGTLGRTAWLDSGLDDYPLAATYNYNIVQHESGLDNQETQVSLPINAYIESGEFDLEDGDRVMYTWRVMPDMTFAGSTAETPSVTMSFKPRYTSGGAYNNPLSQGGNSVQGVTRTTDVPVEQYTGQINIRVRGRQMAMRIGSDGEGVQWQLGTPRLDMRPDGRR